jgi:hypothetical protein
MAKFEATPELIKVLSGMDMGTASEIDSSQAVAARELSSATKAGACMVYALGEIERVTVANVVAEGGKVRGVKAALAAKGGYLAATVNKAGQAATVLHEVATSMDPLSVEAARVQRYWDLEREGTTTPSLVSVALDFVSGDGERFADAVVSIMTNIGASEYFYTVAKGTKVHPSDVVEEEESPEGDEGDDETPESDPEQTLRLALQQAIAAIGKERVSAICLEVL